MREKEKVLPFNIEKKCGNDDYNEEGNNGDIIEEKGERAKADR